MSKLISMTKRNCLVFLKDGGAVFFSLLSMIIVLVLMGVFLGEMNVNTILDLLNEYGGVRDAAADEANAKMLVQYWTLSGLMVVNSLTVTLTVTGTMVNDKISNRLKSFYTAPVSKVLVAVSYMSASVLIGFFFCMLTFISYMIYISITGGVMLSLNTIIKVLALTLLNVVVFSFIMYLVACFVKSSNAWGGIATVVGTLVGFLGAIYVPVGALPEGVVAVLKCIPILHATSLMRKVMCGDALSDTFTNVPAQLIEVYREEMGIDIVMDAQVISNEIQLIFIGLCGVLAMIAIIIVAKKKSY